MSRVAVVVLDTLRRDAFNEHFDWMSGKEFTNAWSTSHWTVPSHASLFTGRYGSEVGVKANAKRLDCEEEVLAESLTNAGCTTRAFSANPLVSPLFEFDRGFEDFNGSWRVKSMRDDMFDWDSFIATHKNEGFLKYPKAFINCIKSDCSTVPSLKYGIKMKLRDLGYGPTKGDGIEEAISYVSDLNPDEDDFIFINLTEAHTPYDPPEQFSKENVNFEGLSATLGEPESPPEDIRNAYDGAVQYLSHKYQQLHVDLKKKYDLVITLSDHGEMLGEHGVWEHLYGIYPELTHIPLTISGNEVPDNISQDTAVNLFDVYETVRQYMGLSETNRGRNLLKPLDQPKDLITEYHGLSNKHYNRLKEQGHTDIEYLQESLSGLISDTYYGYETFLDGFIENEPLSSDEDSGYERLTMLLEKISTRDVTDNETELSETAKKNLEDLGYI
jgi:arylsulfatase A-like enzyme